LPAKITVNIEFLMTPAGSWVSQSIGIADRQLTRIDLRQGKPLLESPATQFRVE
jgi:hypothetical protein